MHTYTYERRKSERRYLSHANLEKKTLSRSFSSRILAKKKWKINYSIVVPLIEEDSGEKASQFISGETPAKPAYVDP